MEQPGSARWVGRRKVEHHDVVEVMRNNERNHWARAGYPHAGSEGYPDGPATFIGPVALEQRLAARWAQRERKERR